MAALPTAPTVAKANLGALSSCAQQISRQAGAASLAFLLATADGDAAAENTYKRRVLELIRRFRSGTPPMGISPDVWDAGADVVASNEWQAVVPPASALFQLTLALDILHPKLTATELTEARASLAPAAQWYYDHSGRDGNRTDLQWQAARIGAYGIWAAFVDDRTRLADAVTQLDLHLASFFTADGLYVDAPLYAADRLGSAGDRDSKAYFVDVLAHLHSLDSTWGKDYYDDPAYRTTMEYYAGYLVTPVLRTGHDEIVAREGFTFGDSWASDSSASRSGRMYSAHRFGGVAARNAAASLRGVGPERVLPLVTTYVLCQQAPPTGTAMVPSRVFPGAGAWFFERGTPSALSGALWCPGWRQPMPPVRYLVEAHHHKDTNALHLTAYGEHVLRNVGYAGFGNAAGGLTWAQIHDTAAVNNVVMIDGQDHVRTTSLQRLPATGIVDSLLWRDIDFACGDSGMALPNGGHKRSLIFLHPSGRRQGYWIVVDEVVDAPAGARASAVWHPNSRTAPRSTRAGYRSSMDIRANGSSTVELTIFPATQPSEVTFSTSGFAEVWYPDNTHIVPSTSNAPVLKATYATSDGAKSFVTILVPSSGPSQPQPVLEQISGPGYTGGRVVHPDSLTVDYALESQNVTDVAIPIGGEAATWRGRAAVVRVAGSSVEQYLLRRGRSFRRGAQGLTATQEISANVRGCGGRIRNNNTGAVNATFFQPGLTAVAVNGVVRPGAGATAAFPPGESTVALLTAPTFGAVADVYVQGGDSNKTIFGTGPTLIVKADVNAAYRREAFLRFDLGVQAGRAVDTAYLVLYAEAVGGGAATLELSEVTDDTWTETNAWPSTPAVGDVLGRVATPAVGGRVAFDVTGKVNELLTGTGSRLFSMRLRVLEAGPDNSVTFASRTHSSVDHRPGLHLSA